MGAFEIWMAKSAADAALPAPKPGESERIKALTTDIADAVDPYSAASNAVRNIGWNTIGKRLGYEAPKQAPVLDVSKAWKSYSSRYPGSKPEAFFGAIGDVQELSDAVSRFKAAHGGVYDPEAFAAQHGIPYGVMHPRYTAVLNDPQYTDLKGAALKGAGNAALGWVKENPWLTGGALAAVLGAGALAFGDGDGEDDDDEAPARAAPAAAPDEWARTRYWRRPA